MSRYKFTQYLLVISIINCSRNEDIYFENENFEKLLDFCINRMFAKVQTSATKRFDSMTIEGFLKNWINGYYFLLWLGTLTEWSQWGDCSATCRTPGFSSPIRSRTRQCQGATLDGNCFGATVVENQDCNSQLCSGKKLHNRWYFHVFYLAKSRQCINYYM